MGHLCSQVAEPIPTRSHFGPRPRPVPPPAWLSSFHLGVTLGSSFFVGGGRAGYFNKIRMIASSICSILEYKTMSRGMRSCQISIQRWICWFPVLVLCTLTAALCLLLRDGLKLIQTRPGYQVSYSRCPEQGAPVPLAEWTPRHLDTQQ